MEGIGARQSHRVQLVHVREPLPQRRAQRLEQVLEALVARERHEVLAKKGQNGFGVDPERFRGGAHEGVRGAVVVVIGADPSAGWDLAPGLFFDGIPSLLAELL